jgi:hypothetical protein
MIVPQRAAGQRIVGILRFGSVGCVAPVLATVDLASVLIVVGLVARGIFGALHIGYGPPSQQSCC